MSDLLTLSEAISKVAPLLGNAIGSPLEAVVLSLIAVSFNSPSKDPKDLLALISNDLESGFKLKKIELDYQILLIQSLKTNNTTLKSIFSRSWEQFIFAIAYLLFFAIIVVLNGIGSIHLDERLVGVLEAAMMNILLYYYGASYKTTPSK